MLRRLGVSLVAVAGFTAASAAVAGPALLFEPKTGKVLYAEPFAVSRYMK